MVEPVSVVLTLREAFRSPNGIQKVKEAALSMGLTPTSEGAATVCCRISEKSFRKLFGESTATVKSQAPNASSAGSPAGYAGLSLPVAESLKEWVEEISILPPAIRMHDSL